MTEEVEKLKLTMKKVQRKTKSGELAKDLKEGYIYFEVLLEGNGKKIVIPKRTRLDKPERMLNKFVTKIKAIAEEQYKEQKYYVAANTPPAIETTLTNESDVNERMLALFEEVTHFVKTKNLSVMKTKVIEF